jgi:hypothetical protein
VPPFERVHFEELAGSLDPTTHGHAVDASGTRLQRGPRAHPQHVAGGFVICGNTVFGVAAMSTETSRTSSGSAVSRPDGQW